jgi:hypothetical protein
MIPSAPLTEAMLVLPVNENAWVESSYEYATLSTFAPPLLFV